MAKRMGSKKKTSCFESVTYCLLQKMGTAFKPSSSQKTQGRAHKGSTTHSQPRLATSPQLCQSQTFLSLGIEGRKWKWQRHDLHHSRKERKCSDRNWISGLCKNDPVKACCKLFMFAVTQLTGSLNSSSKFVNYLPFSLSDFFQKRWFLLTV